eukprot:SAG31_NODE_18056_length_648_cov_1.065574_1_plen_27_part_01
MMAQPCSHRALFTSTYETLLHVQVVEN